MGLTRKNLGCWQNVHARPAARTLLDGERGLKNLFEQIALKNAGRWADAQALAFLQQDDLVGIFAGEVEFVGDYDDGVAIFRGEAAEGDQQIDLRADIEMKGGLVEEQE